jgi:hypothetical protein
MSAAGLAQLTYSPRRKIIASRADHNRSDFIFSRTQSREMRGTPWESRIRPMRTWSEIGAYAGASLAAMALLTAFV